MVNRVYRDGPEAKGAYERALAEASAIFGRDAQSKDLVRTAACLVFIQQYSSVADAKGAYDTALREAMDLFGGDADARDMVRPAACFVFKKK